MRGRGYPRRIGDAEFLSFQVVFLADFCEPEIAVSVVLYHVECHQGLDGVVQERVLRTITESEVRRVILNIEAQDIAKGFEGDGSVDMQDPADGLIKDGQGKGFGTVCRVRSNHICPVISGRPDEEFIRRFHFPDEVTYCVAVSHGG